MSQTFTIAGVVTIAVAILFTGEASMGSKITLTIMTALQLMTTALLQWQLLSRYYSPVKLAWIAKSH